MFVGNGQHLALQNGYAEMGMHMQADFAPTNRVQHRRYLALGSFPQGHDLLCQVADMEIPDKMPAPIVEARHVPTVLAAAVRKEWLPQRAANAPRVPSLAGTWSRSQR